MCAGGEPPFTAQAGLESRLSIPFPIYHFRSTPSFRKQRLQCQGVKRLVLGVLHPEKLSLQSLNILDDAELEKVLKFTDSAPLLPAPYLLLS